MSNQDQISSLPRTVHGDTTIDDGSPTAEGQGGLLHNLFPSSHGFVVNDVCSFIERLNVWRQRLDENAEAMKELYNRRQSMLAEQNSAMQHTAFLPSTERRFSRGEADVFQYPGSQSFSMDTFHHTDTVGAGPHIYRPMWQQAWATSLHNMQTSMSDIRDESLRCREVASYHDKRTTWTHATSLQAMDYEYGIAPDIGFACASSCLPGQSLIPAGLTDTSDIRNGNAGLSTAPSGDENGRSPVLSFMSGGIKHYRCECGFESARKRDVERHRESLRHSQRKYECPCGKKFTRNDSLNRHKKRCRAY